MSPIASARAALLAAGEPAYDPITDGPTWLHSYYAEGDEMQALAYASGGAVSPWSDETATADALQATADRRPLFRRSAISPREWVQGDSINDFLSVDYGADTPQPWSRVMIAAMEVSASVNVPVSGYVSGKQAAVFVNLNDKVSANAGSAVADGDADTDWHLFVLVGNGASSILEIDGVQVLATNLGANPINGITLFANFNSTTSASSASVHFVADYAGNVLNDAAWPDFEAWALARIAALGASAPADEHVVMTGQSLARGPLDTVTNVAPYPANVFRAAASGSLTPLLAETYESPAIGLAVAVHEERVTGTISASVNPGAGLTYQQIKKGTATYQGAIDVCASAAVDLVEAVHVVHGEADTRDATPVATYEANLNEWQTDYDTDIKAATGQVTDVHMILAQTVAWLYYEPINGIDHATIGLAQFNAHRNNANITLACSEYQLAGAVDGLHLTGAGSHHLGELLARAHTAVVDGAGWDPLMPLSVIRTGALVVVEFDVPVAPLVFDTTIVPAQTNFGFTYHDDTSTAAIASVALGVNGTSVEITLDAVPTGANPHIGYGYSGTKYGNLCDSEPAVSTLDATPLANWCVHFYEPVTT